MRKVKQCLIVDDDPASRYLAKEAMKEIDLAEQIITQENGFQALDYIREKCISNQMNCPELILLDIKMPVMDGYEFMEELAKIEKVKNNDTTIILFSSAAYLKKEKNVSRFNILGYIEKPATSEKLIEIINNNTNAR